MRLDNECDGDFSSFYFDVDMITKKITISDKTPERLRQIILADFEKEIGYDCCWGLVYWYSPFNYGLNVRCCKTTQSL